MEVPSLRQSLEKASDGNRDLKAAARLAGILILLAIVALAFWVVISPFPEPSTLTGRSFASVASQLGPSTGALPDKLFEWEVSRGVAVWTLEASYVTWPVQLGSVTVRIKRCLWIKWAGMSVLCRSATVVGS
jgi:hypothetical protein